MSVNSPHSQLLAIYFFLLIYLHFLGLQMFSLYSQKQAERALLNRVD